MAGLSGICSPFFAKETTSWEGHLSGAIAGTICAIAFMEYGPQRPDLFADEEETPDEESEKRGRNMEEEENTEVKADCNRPKKIRIIVCKT